MRRNRIGDPGPDDDTLRTAFVCIVTYGRSGSTLVQSLISSLEHAHISGENNGAFFSIAEAFHRAEEARRHFGNAETAADDPWYGASNIDLEKFGVEIARAFINNVMKPPANSRIIGFKEIRWFECGLDLEWLLSFVRKFFPPPRFIFNIRDPEKVAASAWWRRIPRDRAMELIGSWNAELRACAARHPSDCYLLDFDMIVDDPSRLEDLFKFLGADYSSARCASIMKKYLTHLK